MSLPEGIGVLGCLTLTAFSRVEHALREEFREAHSSLCSAALRRSGRLEQAMLFSLLDILRFLSPIQAFGSLPATSRSMAALFGGDARRWISQGLLWPSEDDSCSRDRGGSAAAAFWPSTALGKEGVKDIEALETVLSERTERLHLERLFLWSVREGWAERGASRERVRPQVAPPNGVDCLASGTSGPSYVTAGGPVLWATRRAGRGSAAKEVAWLVRWGADVNETDQNGWTPLIWAAHRNAHEVCRLLLRHRADPDHIGREGSSALSIACRCAHSKVVSVLFEFGASPFLVPIGNGNFDYHVGDEILQMVREQRRKARSDTSRQGRFSL